MNRSRTLFLVVSLAILAPLAVGLSGVLWSATSQHPAKDDGDDSLFKYLAVFSEVLGLVRQNYVDPTDLDALLAGALDGSTDALDPFSVYLPASAADRFAKARAVGGSRSGLFLLKDRGVLYAVAVEEGSPAAKGGVETGDILSMIDGHSTRDMPYWEALSQFAGDAGTKHELKLLRRGETKTASVVLGEFDAPKPKVTEVRGVPVLRVARFEAGTAEAVGALLDQLAGTHADKLLVDLRSTAGGDPAAAYAVARCFAKGALGAEKARDKTLRDFKNDAAPRFAGRLAVAVDGSTLGAAEILAAILEQSAGAKVVGQHTFGHVGAQEMTDLSGGAKLLLTTSFFTGPDGKPLVEGLSPDLLVDESTRAFGDRERPLSELILERGVDQLLGIAETAKKAA